MPDKSMFRCKGKHRVSGWVEGIKKINESDSGRERANMRCRNPVTSLHSDVASRDKRGDDVTTPNLPTGTLHVRASTAFF